MDEDNGSPGRADAGGRWDRLMSAMHVRRKEEPDPDQEYLEERPPWYDKIYDWLQSSAYEEVFLPVIEDKILELEAREEASLGKDAEMYALVGERRGLRNLLAELEKVRGKGE